MERAGTSWKQPEPERLRGSEEEGGVAPEAEVWGRETGQSPTANGLKAVTHVAVAGRDPESRRGIQEEGRRL